MKRYIWLTLSLLIFNLYSFRISAECIVNAQTDKNSLLVGDSLTLTINLRYKDGEVCKIDENVSLSKFKLLKRDLKTEKNGTQLIDTYTFILTPLDLGEIEIPPININTSTDGGFSDEEAGLSTPAIKISVQGIIQNEQDAKLKDILPPEKVYERTYILLYILGGLTILALIIYLIWRHLKNRKKTELKENESSTAISILSPYEEAIISLKLLEDEKLISKSMYKEFYLRLTEILKRFIERFYGFNAVEMTTSELTTYLIDHPQPNLDLTEVKNFLYMADLIKFAKYIPDAEMAYRDFNNIRNIIEKAAGHTNRSDPAQKGSEK